MAEYSAGEFAHLHAPLELSEADSVAALGVPLNLAQREQALQSGRALVEQARARTEQRPYLDAFLQEFGLSNPEGVALMCLAESLLRVPDDETADRLIAEKIAAGNWSEHAGRSESLFVNASTWALMLTGRLVELPEGVQRDPGSWLGRISRRAGEPLVRQAMRRAMAIIGGEFVVGRDIESALQRSRDDPALALCSFDMLGEGARNDAQAKRYFAAYAHAIEAIAQDARERGNASDGSAASLHARSEISVKLSALDPRYALVHRERVHERLVPRALELARLAAGLGLGLTVDAEEAERLEISLEVFAALARDARTRDWPGLGLAVQAYGRRAPAVIESVVALAGATRRVLSVRLVKGAYWDSEIKRAQERGLETYAVYTRKASTDVAYLECARRLFAAGSAIHAQFATHNAHTIGAVLALRPHGRACEFQRLHGMGTLLYDAAARLVPDLPPVRVYAPVGAHADLLAYLVRRLLENGANSSFVNRFLNERVPIEQVVTDPIAELAALESVADPRLPLPPELYAPLRRNSRGVDLGRSDHVAALVASVTRPRHAAHTRDARGSHDPHVKILNPADRSDRVGEIAFADRAQVEEAFRIACEHQRPWSAMPAGSRAALLERGADALEAARPQLLPLLVREAGKTYADAIAEIREAADFCRYYAAEARRLFESPLSLPGPTGESNALSLEGRGVLACISPWNFPLAIFTGQVAAALAAGNAVLAKPAESTPLVAAAAVACLHDAGVPREVLHLLPMTGRAFGEAALSHEALAGVVFTGSTTTARWLNRALAAREGALLPLVAETGGVNAMIVDSTALIEQVVDDVVASAFQSAGQRCSALRLLCVQDDVADELVEALVGAMDALEIGNPAQPRTDVGPVISTGAAEGLARHVERMRGIGRVLHVCRLPEGATSNGSFFAPHLIELPQAGTLREEAFGPVLHVVRYASRDLEAVLAEIRRSGFALTMGVQTRLDLTWRRAFEATTVGNVYVNRNIIGAVVGVQPFGGSGLSGTGPKAGGPHYLPRLAIERTLTINTTAAGGNTSLLSLN